MSSHGRTTVIALSEHRGNPRIYLEGRWLIAAGFAPGGSYCVRFLHRRVTIEASEQGRAISGKRGNRSGVIDLNCTELRQAFDHAWITRLTVHAETGRIDITPGEIVLRRLSRELTPKAVSLFAGGGLLSQAARMAGFDICAAIEINPRYADIFQDNHRGWMLNCSVEAIPWDHFRGLGPIGLLEAGIPCEPYSAIRRLDRRSQTKRRKDLPPEAHELGDMVYWALKAADLLNPHTILIEEVPQFLNSGAGSILLHALSRMGYTVDARVVNPLEYGALTGRRRAVIVATTFDQVLWPSPEANRRRLGEILEDVPDDSPLWFNRQTKPWLYEHWERQTSRGNGFEPPRLTAQHTSCPTIKKRYFAGQGDNPVVQHPRKDDHHRWLTLTEVRRLMDLPEDYQLGDSLTTAGEVLGQGVHVQTFARIIQSVTQLGSVPDCQQLQPFVGTGATLPSPTFF